MKILDPYKDFKPGSHFIILKGNKCEISTQINTCETISTYIHTEKKNRNLIEHGTLKSTHAQLFEKTCFFFLLMRKIGFTIQHQNNSSFCQ